MHKYKIINLSPTQAALWQQVKADLSVMTLDERIDRAFLIHFHDMTIIEDFAEYIISLRETVVLQQAALKDILARVQQLEQKTS